jgi:hypothetical protein
MKYPPYYVSQSQFCKQDDQNGVIETVANSLKLFGKTNQLIKEEKKLWLLKSGRVKKREKPIGLAAIMRTPTALTASISAAAWPEDGSRWWDTTSRSSSAVSFALL